MKQHFHLRAFCFLLAAALGAAHVVLAKPATNPPDIILITVDTLRADHVGCYGSKNAATPGMDSLAHDGVLFEQAISQVPLTWPSHAAILTGTYPFANGVQDFTGQPLSNKFRTLAESLKARGYATGAVVSSFVLDRSWGLARGFDSYDDAFSGESFVKQRDVALVERRAKESVDHALAWLEHPRSQPYFFWLHLYDPHSPYDAPEPFRTRYRSHPYDGEIAYVDSQLVRLISWLKRSGRYDHTLVVLLSDHGESLGEHGESEHGFFVYNATLYVPLIIKPAKSPGAPGRHIAGPVESISVAPTILQLAGVQDPIQKQFQAAGLAAIVDAGQSAGDHPSYSETFYPYNSFGWSPLRSLQSTRYHFIEAPDPELYDLQSDPREEHNIFAKETNPAQSLRQQLQNLVAHFQPSSQGQQAADGAGPSPEAIEKLRSLGYVAYRAANSKNAPASGLPDPKSKLWEYHAIMEATDAFSAGKYDAGRALLKRVQTSDARIYVVPFMLGEAASRQADWATAAAEFQKCLDLNPYFDQAMMGLGRALGFEGRIDQAKQWFERALAINPQNFRAWFELARVEKRVDSNAAKTSLEKALSIQPGFAPAYRDLGILAIEQKSYGEAAQDREKAVQFGLADPSTLNYLGISYSRTNRLELAMKTYRRALAADPKFAQAHLNLGFVFQRMGREKEAKQEYETACRLDKNLCQYKLSSQE
ncbi:MAG: sulfatase-like hydrolase/transferase [Candidatus Acidiferrales bacterium]